MNLFAAAQKELVECLVGGQADEEKSIVAPDDYRFNIINSPNQLISDGAGFEYLEHKLHLGLPLGTSSSEAYLTKQDAAAGDWLDLGQGSAKEIYEREQFGIFCDLARIETNTFPSRAEIQSFELEFWLGEPRQFEEIQTHRERVKTMLENDEEEGFGRDVAASTGPRSKLSQDDRVLRDHRHAIDWLRLQTMRGSVRGEANNVSQSEQMLAPARWGLGSAANFAASYLMYDVFATDCAVLKVAIEDERGVNVAVDVTDLIRNQKDDLFAEAAAMLPDPGVPGYDRFLLIDLWRKGGGREDVLGEYPFWLKR